VLELVVCTTAFWTSTGAVFRETIASSSTATEATNATAGSNTSSLKESLFKRPAARTTWLCCVFLFGYVGTEVALGGWIVTFMLRVRDGSAFSSGMTATGFWLGLTMGRLILGFVTPKIGEKLAIAIYLPLSMALQLLFWLVPSFLLSAIFVALEGFFLGPLFPAAVVVMTKLLPKHLHVTAIGFVVAFGGCGAAVFPFVVGAVAEATSVRSLQPLILGMLALILCTWVALPRLRKRD
jgi:fucose permease